MIGELALALIKCLKHFFYISKSAHLGLNTSTVYFDLKNRRFRLLFGMSKKMSIVKEKHAVVENKIKLYNRLRKNYWIDLFDVGLILMSSYFGENIERVSSIIGFSLRYLLSKTIKSPYLPSNCIQYCCIFHFIEEQLNKVQEELTIDIDNLELKYGLEDLSAFFVCLDKI
jgi:hypothetical protein